VQKLAGNPGNRLNELGELIMLSKRVPIIFILCMIFQGTIAFAETQRMRPERISTAESIDFLTNTIIFDGHKYQLTEKTKWYGLEPGEDPRNSTNLKNRRMGYTLAFPKNGIPVVTQVWLY
jgi:hypothetical protein